MAGNGRRQRRHSWHLRQRCFCNLQILNEVAEFESHPLRHPPSLAQGLASARASARRLRRRERADGRGWSRWSSERSERLRKRTHHLRQHSHLKSIVYGQIRQAGPILYLRVRYVGGLTTMTIDRDARRSSESPDGTARGTCAYSVRSRVETTGPTATSIC
jgi:hypothetical protein